MTEKAGERFTTEVPGKWVLAGEHTVLRGGEAIALPHPEFRLKFEFTPGEEALDFADLGSLFDIARDWLNLRGMKVAKPKGSLRIESTIPRGAGLGSSAALSVAIARFILVVSDLDQGVDRLLERELAREMENHFHGKSSGMDIAVVSLGEPIRFSMKDGASPLGVRRLPPFVFIDTGLRASTRECIAKVDALRKGDSGNADRLDSEMRTATREISEGLRAYEEKQIIDGVANGMKRAGRIFAEWGLVPTEVARRLAELEAEGVISPRLTGAGGGGFIVGIKPKSAD